MQKDIRGALRWLTELWRAAQEHGIRLCSYQASAERECDGTAYLWAPHLEAGMQLRKAITKYVEPHIPRGASVSMEEWQVKQNPSADLSLENMVNSLGKVLFDSKLLTHYYLEDSSGWEGYSHPAQLSFKR